MTRKIAGVLFAGLFVTGLALAAADDKDTKKDDKPPKFDTVIGMFESYKDEVLKLTVETKKQEFQVPGDTPVGYVAGSAKKVLKAKDHLKDTKKGTFVAVTLQGKKVLGVGVVVDKLPEGKSEDKDKEEKDKDK